MTKLPNENHDIKTYCEDKLISFTHHQSHFLKTWVISILTAGLDWLRLL